MGVETTIDNVHAAPAPQGREAGITRPGSDVEDRLEALLATRENRPHFDHWLTAVRHSFALSAVVQLQRGTLQAVEISEGFRQYGPPFDGLKPGDTVNGLLGETPKNRVKEMSELGLFDGEVQCVKGVWTVRHEDDRHYFRAVNTPVRDDLGAWIEGDLFSYSPPHDRRHQVNAVASYELAGFTVNASWEFGTGRPYTKVYGFNLALDLPEQFPTSSSGTAQTFYDRPYGARMPPYHRLDVSVERSFDLSPSLSIETKAGAINTYNRDNIFYYDVNSIRRVNQTPLLPYLSLRVIVK